MTTDKDRAQIETLAGLGLRQEEICLLIKNPQTSLPITEKTLRRHFANELAWGSVKAHANIAKSLYDKGIGDGPQAVTAAIWFSKCRMGWKERQVVDVESKSGVLLPQAAMTPEEWIRSAAARAVGKKEPVPGGCSHRLPAASTRSPHGPETGSGFRGFSCETGGVRRSAAPGGTKSGTKRGSV